MTLRRGYTLIELLVATASASVLMIGLSSALYVSSRALETDEGATLVRNSADMALSRVLAEVAEAIRFTTLDSTTLEFTVPDRDADGQFETLRYGWSGIAGDPLMRSLNGGTDIPMIRDVQSLDFVKLTQTLTALDVTIVPPPPWPVLESFSSAKLDSNVNQLVLAAPAGVLEGEALLACVVVHDVPMSSMIPPAGWMQLDLNEDANHVTFGLWWKLAGASEPADYAWRWTGDDEAIGVALRISNQYAGNPFTAIATSSGKARSAECVATAATLDNSMILRIGGFHKDTVDTTGETGLPAHTDVYMDAVNEASCGVGYQVLKSAGDTGAASFALKNSKEYRTLTVVVAPKQ